VGPSILLSLHEVVEQPEKTPLGQMEKNPDMLSGERKAESVL